MKPFIDLSAANIDNEHICCAFSDAKCKESYALKKEWLKSEFEKGYVFRRLDERAKVFIEYGPAETAWLPVEAQGYLNVNCLWVSGQYKGKGYAKALLETAMDDARRQGKKGLVTVVGTKKFHFMSDIKWLLKQGFVETDRNADGFSVLTLLLEGNGVDLNAGEKPVFKASAKTGECPIKEGIVVYYSNRCPFAEYHVTQSLVETATKRNIPYTLIKLETMEMAQSAPTPATIFSLYYEGKFITTDLSVCMDSRFDKIRHT